MTPKEQRKAIKELAQNLPISSNPAKRVNHDRTMWNLYCVNNGKFMPIEDGLFMLVCDPVWEYYDKNMNA